jgi:hypothetical protein
MSRPSGTRGEPGPEPVRHGRSETWEERADRRWSEQLQEVRVAQTGAQILFGFLLSVAFLPRFGTLGHFDRGLYVTTVVLGALATGTLIAPVSFHRLLAGRRLKPELVAATQRLLAVGVALLGLTIGSALLLLLRTVLPAPAAGAVTGAVMAWFVLCWVLFPALLLRHHR